LRIKGRGLDFVWARKYRSRAGVDTAQGHGWDFGYNLYIQQPDPQKVEVHDGNTRSDVFLQQLDGTFALDEFFREGVFSNGFFVLEFPDGGAWEFLPFGGGAAQGKINRIIDRNGNALSFQYDGSGLLAGITDTLGRLITVGYTNIAGTQRIGTVMDFAGRTVRYEYYKAGEEEGSPGDLKSVTSPAVTGTPNGNDFPQGKTTVYTYSRGFVEEELNHNLLSIRDGKGQVWLLNTYSEAKDFLHDRVVRQIWGYDTEMLKIHYAPQTPGAGNQYAILKTIVNDRVGNVSEYLFDARNRCVSQRVYTGRADATRATTERLNRPTNPLRGSDPAYFETRYVWNVDALATQVIYPNGNSVSNYYERAFNPSANPRARANVRARTFFTGPLGGDESQLVEQFQYGPTYGGCCGGTFVTNYIDPNGNITRHAYDSRGNRTNTIYAVSGVVESWEYNAYGQMTAHILPDNGSGYRRRDSLVYYTGGPQTGYLQMQIVDAGGAALTTSFVNDERGNVLIRTGPDGRTTLFTVNALDQVVRLRASGTRS
jgi:YD repeat-containing protein